MSEDDSIRLDVLANDSGAAPLTLLAVTTPTHGEASLSGSTILYRAPASVDGSDSFQYQFTDATGATATGTVSVDITAINHAPSFDGGADLVVPEDFPPAAIRWATAIDAGDDHQSVHFVTSASNPDLFTMAPAIDPTGTLRFAPAPDAFGVAHVDVTAVDDGGTANGDAARSATQTFTLTVSPVDDPPSFAAGGDVTVVEGAGPQSRAWATAISPGPKNEADQHVTFKLTDDNPSLFATAGRPSIARNGTLTFDSAPFATGSARVTVTASDDGAATDGADNSVSTTFTIDVLPVNHAPALTDAGNQAVLEDASAQTVQWATGIDPGAPNEAAQTVTLTTSNDNPSLFSSQPTVDQTGVLTYTPAPDANGSAEVTVTAQDDGGTANGGHDTTTATFSINVAPVNDAPSLSTPSGQSVLEDDGPQAVALTSISPGPTDESSQTTTLSTSTDHPEYFDLAGEPFVAADGTLTFTPAQGRIWHRQRDRERPRRRRHEQRGPGRSVDPLPDRDCAAAAERRRRFIQCDCRHAAACRSTRRAAERR